MAFENGADWRRLILVPGFYDDTLNPQKKRELKLQQGEPTLTVADNGPGIDKAVAPRVFERFVTGDEVSGSGLGLSIARDLARLMGGSLELSARTGRTEFILRLPAPAEVLA